MKKEVLLGSILMITMMTVVGCSSGEIDEKIENQEMTEVVEKEKVDLDSIKEKVLKNKKISASSTLNASGGVSYGVKNVIDGNLNNAWVEGKKDDGIGEWIEIDLEKDTIIKDILLINGYGKNSDIYYKNNRVKKAEIEFSDGTKIKQDFKDGIGSFQRIELENNILTKKIKIKILEVYEGSKYSDTAISEIKIIGIDGIDKLKDDEKEFLKIRNYKKEEIKKEFLEIPSYSTEDEYSEFTHKQAMKYIEKYIEENVRDLDEILQGDKLAYAFEKTGVQATIGYNVDVKIHREGNSTKLFSILVLENGEICPNG